MFFCYIVHVFELKIDEMKGLRFPKLYATKYE